MLNPKLSLMGLYKYDGSLFDLMDFPAGLDRDAVLALILSESAEFNAQYPDFELCKNMLGCFSARMKTRWQKLYDTTTLEYSPIENYDRFEERLDTVHGQDVTSSTAFENNLFKPTGSVSSDNHVEIKARTHGNIGVTTSQQMIESERDVWQFDIYRAIADDVIDNFCVCKY